MRALSQMHIGGGVRRAIGGLLVAASLTACAVVAGPAGDTTGTASATPSAGGLAGSTAWIVGTFALEGTADAVGVDQAAELLPLWKAHRSLSQSDSAAPAEQQALLDQIEETMTESQREAIAAMQLTGQDLEALMEEQGIATQGAGSGAGGTSSGRAADTGNPVGAGAPSMPVEGALTSGAMPGMGGDTTGRSLAAPEGGAGTTNVALVDAVIALLEAKL